METAKGIIVLIGLLYVLVVQSMMLLAFSEMNDMKDELKNENKMV